MRPAAVVRRSALLLLAALLLSGCALLGGLVNTENRLRDAGHAEASVSLHEEVPGPGPILTVTWLSSARSQGGYLEEVGSITRIVWTKAPLRFTVLRLEPTNPTTFRDVVTFTRDELAQRYGPRPAGLKEEDVEDVGRAFARGIVILLVGGFLVLAAIALTIVLVVRRNRRNRAQQGDAGGWAPGSPMWGQPTQPGAWGQQPWGQPPPPGSWSQPAQPPGDPNDPWKQPPP